MSSARPRDIVRLWPAATGQERRSKVLAARIRSRAPGIGRGARIDGGQGWRCHARALPRLIYRQNGAPPAASGGLQAGNSASRRASMKPAPASHRGRAATAGRGRRTADRAGPFRSGGGRGIPSIASAAGPHGAPPSLCFEALRRTGRHAQQQTSAARGGRLTPAALPANVQHLHPGVLPPILNLSLARGRATGATPARRHRILRVSTSPGPTSLHSERRCRRAPNALPGHRELP